MNDVGMMISVLCFCLLCFSAAIWVALWVTTRESSAIQRIMAQAEDAARAQRAMNDKLTSKMMAMMDPQMYLAYRNGAWTGVPEGSMNPPTVYGPPPRNGADDDALAKAVADLQRRMEEDESYTGPRRVDIPSDYEQGPD